MYADGNVRALLRKWFRNNGSRGAPEISLTYVPDRSARVIVNTDNARGEYRYRERPAFETDAEEDGGGGGER